MRARLEPHANLGSAFNETLQRGSTDPMPALDHLRVAGFKSIRDQEIDLRSLNLLIGANGAGKSNLIAVFELLHEIVAERLQVYVGKAGGAEPFLYFGSKTTEDVRLRLDFGDNAYECTLLHSVDSLIFGEEGIHYRGRGFARPVSTMLGSGHEETRLNEESRKRSRKTVADHVLEAVESWRVYHFHDTSASARMKKTGDLEDNEYLREDAANLAAFLYRLERKEPDVYRNIVDTVRMVAPFFADFRLRPSRLNEDKIRLEWQERGSDAYFNAHALSDGTLRFICLATLLLQPDPPTTILLDEPELGLHPAAITVLAGLLGSASTKTQIVASTQSVTLVNQFEPEDLLVVDRRGPESVFRRLSEAEIDSWLDDYSLGELWEKNVLGGRPAG